MEYRSLPLQTIVGSNGITVCNYIPPQLDYMQHMGTKQKQSLPAAKQGKVREKECLTRLQVTKLAIGEGDSTYSKCLLSHVSRQLSATQHSAPCAHAMAQDTPQAHPYYIGRGRQACRLNSVLPVVIFSYLLNAVPNIVYISITFVYFCGLTD